MSPLQSLAALSSTHARLAAAVLLLIASLALPAAGADIVTGPGAGGAPQVRRFDSATGLQLGAFQAFDPAFTGGVYVAMGDVTGDSVADTVVGAGPGSAPQVKVFDGVTGLEVRSFLAYDPSFTGGVRVALGDVTGDGRADIVTGAGPGGQPHVRVFDGVTGLEVRSFLAYDAGFTGGVYVAAGDVTGDGLADLVTGKGEGGLPHVRVFDGVSGLEVMSFLAYDPSFTTGVRVAAGDVNGDGRADIVTGAATGTGSNLGSGNQSFPDVTVIDGATGMRLRAVLAFPASPTGGVHVAAGDLNGDGRAEVLAGAGAGSVPHVRVFDGATGNQVLAFMAYDLAFTGGVRVAAPVSGGAPIVIPATFSVAEHSAVGTAVGTVTFIDPSPGETHTFSLMAGNVGGAFALDPASGQLTVASSAALNFEASPVFSLLVQVTDSGTPPQAGSAVITVTLTDVNEPPVVSPAAFGVAEHSAPGTLVGIPVAVADPDAGQTHTFAITAGNTGGAFAINPGSGQLSVASAAALDFEATPVFSLTVEATDSGTPPLSGSATVTVTLADVNDAPVVTPATFSLAENSPGGTVVGTVTATDSDAGQTRTFSITAGNTGGAFAIDPATGDLSVANAAALNFEATPVFSLTVQATDNGTPPAAGTATVTVTLTDVNEPPVVTPATFGLAEHSPGGTVVGTVAVTDPDAGQTHTFAITAGNTGGAFAIDPATGQLTVATPAAVDFETTPTFSLTVEATDTGTPFLSGSATITVNLTDANDAPVVDAATFTVAENSATGTLVGTPVTFTDQDAGQTHTFAITAGNTGGAFAIDPATGQLTVATPAAVDFEITPTFSLTVEVTDDGTPPRSGTATITVTLTDVNDAPVAQSQMESMSEDGAPLTITLTASDQDDLALPFTIVTPPQHGVLSAVVPTPCVPDGTGGATCTATVTYTPTPDFSGTDSFTFRVNDGTVDSNVAVITITLGAVPDAPVANSQSVATAEDTPLLITLSGMDVDGQALAFSLGTGPTNGTLDLPFGAPVCQPPDSNGAVTCTATVTYTPFLNFNGGDSFTFTVNDGSTASAPATVTITVALANDPPVAQDVLETTAEETPTVITLTATDVDSGTLTFSVLTLPAVGLLSATNPAAVCSTDPGTGLTTCTADVTYTPPVDFSGQVTFTYKANDGSADSNTATVTIDVTPVPDAPTAASQSVSTDQDVALLITLTGTDPDSLSLTFSPGTGPTSGTLGAFSSPASCVPDGSGGTSCTVTVTYTPNAGFFGSDSFTFTVNDGTLTSAPGTVSITVIPPNTAPTVNPATFSLAENSANGTNVGTPVTFTDPDAGQTHTFSITAGNTNNAFAINASTGQITVATSAAVNFEVTPSFSLTVQVQDNGVVPAAGTATITVNLTNVNEAPVVNPATFSLAENSANGTVVGTVTFTDQDAGQTGTFSITAGNTGGAFAINAGTGQITVATTGALNFEVTPTFSLTVQVLDNGTPALSGTATVTVNLTNVNEAPVVNPATFSIAENSANGTNVGTPVTFTDPDAGQTRTFSITAGNTNNAFAINASTGQITVATTAALNFEVTPSFSLTVQVLDNGTPALSGTATVTVNLTNVNEAPVVNPATFTPNENSANGTVVGTVTFTDQDTGQTGTFSITAGNTGGAFAINAGTGQITVATTGALNFEVTPSFSLTVQVQDNGAPVLAGTATITVNLTNVNEAPVAQNKSYTAQANMKISTPAGSGLLVGATDEDSPAQVLSVGAVSVTTPAGGTVTVNAATGAFDFDPPAGATGAVTFTYTVCDDGSGFGGVPVCSAARTVTFTVASPVIWFVAPNLGANGTGTLFNPFNVLASANTAKGTNPGHRIFVYHSTTPATGVTTEAGVGVTLDVAGSQQLVGQGVTGTDFDTVMGLTVPAGTIARPGINGTRPVIQGTVAMNGTSSVVRGLNITPSTAGAAGLTGGAVTGVTTGEVSVTTGTGTAVNLNGTGGTVNLASVTSTGGTAVSINAGSGTVTISGTVSRTGAAATGVSVTNRTSGTVTFSGATKTLNTATSPAVSLTNNTGATINFTGGGLDIDTTSGAGFSATGGGTINVSGSTNTITTGTGTGLLLNGTGGAVDLDSVTSTGGTAVNITAGSGTVTVSGTVSRTGAAATGISVTNRTSGTVTFSGGTKTLDTATSPAVTLTNNTGATINFTGGGLDIDTTSATGFNATGGGTVNVSGSGNTINSTSATALNVTSTTIGSSGLTFQSISAGNNTAAADPAKGIILNGTGASFGLTVTGTGTTAGSGGTIQRTTSNGGEFISSNHVSLSNMNFTNNGTAQTVAGSAATCGGALLIGNNLSCVSNIHLQSVNTVSLTNVSVTNSGQMGVNGNNVTDLTISGSTITGNGNESFENGLTFQNLLGTSSITDTMIKDNAATQISVVNIASSSALTLAITGTRTNNVYPTIDTSTTEIGKTTQTNTFTDQSLLINTLNTSTNVNITLNVTGVVFRNSLPGNSMLLNPNAGAGSSFSGTTTNTSFHNTAGGVIIQGQNNHNVTYNVTNSEFNRVNLQSILYSALNPYAGTMQGTVSGNHIGEDSTGTAGKACEPVAGSNCTGIDVNYIGGSGSISTRIENNRLQQFDGNGIRVVANGSGSPDVNINIVNNIIQNPLGLIAHGIDTNMGTTSGANVDGCLGITSNTITGTYEDPGVGQLGIHTRVRFLSTHRLPGLVGGGASQTPATAQAFIDGNNGGDAGKVFSEGNGVPGYVGGASCATP